MGRSVAPLVLRWLAGLALAVLALVAPAQGGPPDGSVLVLHDAEPEASVWPAVRLLADPQGALDWRAALARLGEFTPPTGPTGNLGLRREPVWLTLAVRAADGNGRWIFDLDYPAFNVAELHVVSEGRLIARHTLGSGQPFEARPMHTRTHAVELALPPGRDCQLLVRLQTDSAMVLPLSLSKPDAYHAREAHRLVGQGLMFGITAALLLYSLFNGLHLRNGLFGLYALLLLGTTAFFVDFSGLGQQFLWSERQGMTALLSPLSVLLATAAGGPFIAGALQTATHSPRLHRALTGQSALAAALLLVGLAGLLSYRQAQVLASVIGPLTPVLAFPAAWRRARQGERIGLFMLAGWGCYVAGAASTVCLLRGLLPANVWTLHLYQWATLLEMLAWLRVLGLRIEAVRLEAERNAAAVRDLSAIAQTDALTGLPNRRALDTALPAAVERSRADDMLAVLLIDLDGFKAVNDRYGHAVGDQLLVEVARRMTLTLRRQDLVARLGGDEFVVLAQGMGSEAQALRIGQKLIDAFAAPVVIDGQPCAIGLTIGYTLAPADSRDPVELLRMADTAMYTGKRAGRRQVRRCAPAGIAA